MQIIIFVALIVSAFVGGTLVVDKGEYLASQTLSSTPTPTQKTAVENNPQVQQETKRPT